MHLATCGYCWVARTQLYHRCIPIYNSKSVWLQCGYCARTVNTSSRMVYPCGWWERSGGSWMVYPCGWWQRVSRVYTARICRCAYLDMLGYLLHGGARIFSKHNFLMAHATALQIDYIQGLQFQVSGRRVVTVYSNEHHGRLDISDIIRVTAFQKMVPLVGYFLRHTLPKLQASRVNSLILKSLPLLAIRRLSWSNTAFRASLVGVSSPTDATLASYMYRGAHNQQRPRDLTQPAWQWQQFTNPTTQGRWFWRMADGEWFNMGPAQYVGYGPAGTWHRYEDPTSRCCFWWRHNDDWGWEQRSGDLHAPERPSGFQGPEIFASAANAHVCPGATATEVDTRKRTRHISRMKERREYTEMLLLEATVLASEADRPRTPDPDDPALSSKRCWERAKIEWSVEINNVIAAARERDLEINTQGPHA